MTRPAPPALALVLALTLAACDAGFEGDLRENRAPDTELSVRSSDLRDDLDGRRVLSTVEVSWSGTDADGVVTAYDVRSYPSDAAPADGEGWARTARRDSTLRLAIPLGQSTADVVVEVRAVDDEGAVDPTPARTVFPIVNSPPTLRLVAAEAPPDTTWPVVSFAVAAADVDGEANLAGLEVSLNDGPPVRLDADVTFLTLVAEDPRADVTAAAVYTGRGFRNAGVALDGLRLDADNVLTVQAVDQAGATSAPVRYPALDDAGDPVETFFVRRVTSDVLLVNDVRVGDDALVLGVAAEALAVHGTASYDEWDLSATPQSTASPRLSDALPVSADPTLRQTLALWDRIYWVSNAVTNSAVGNNLPLAATVLDLFFERGGRILVQVPVSLPQGADAGGTANAAIDLLPLSALVTFPTGVTFLRAGRGTPLRPVADVPGTGRALPALEAQRIVTGAVPYAVGPDDVPLYRMSFYEGTRPEDAWTGPEVVASIRADRRTALFGLPLFAGTNPFFGPAEGGTEGVVDALALLLDGLEFPRGTARLARR